MTDGHPAPTDPEVALGGGSMNHVVRDGDRVLRQAGPWTPTVHRYLHYLHQAGIDWVPRPLAIHPAADGPGQERLSYLPGDVPAYPLPTWVWAPDVLRDGGTRLRQLHDASIGFSLAGAVWHRR